MRDAAVDACAFVEGLARDDFLKDRCTQRAVIMSLLIIGEASTKIMDSYAGFAQAHPEVPWRGMRNRIAHGYFDTNLDVVWDTVQVALPGLLEQLAAVSRDARGPADR